MPEEMDGETTIKAAASIEERPSERARWLAALGYVSFFSVFALWRAGRDAFVRFHASQGFLLFLAEIAFLAVTLILELTVGRIKIAGLIIVSIFIFVTGMTALVLSAIGFVKALFGERWQMPVIGKYIDRVPAE